MLLPSRRRISYYYRFVLGRRVVQYAPLISDQASNPLPPILLFPLAPLTLALGVVRQ